MIRCSNGGNSDDFYHQYFRPPVKRIESENGEQSFVIYRCGKASEAANPDLYSAKRTIVNSGARFALSEKRAFGAIALGGHGTIGQPGKEAIPLESVSMFPSRKSVGGDEIFVTATAADHLTVQCNSLENLLFYQHFGSDSNPEASSLERPPFNRFSNELDGELGY
jgi:hypothetical protein